MRGADGALDVKRCSGVDGARPEAEAIPTRMEENAGSAGEPQRTSTVSTLCFISTPDSPQTATSPFQSATRVGTPPTVAAGRPTTSDGKPGGSGSLNGGGISLQTTSILIDAYTAHGGGSPLAQTSRGGRGTPYLRRFSLRIPRRAAPLTPPHPLSKSTKVDLAATAASADTQQKQDAGGLVDKSGLQCAAAPASYPGVEFPPSSQSTSNLGAGCRVEQRALAAIFTEVPLDTAAAAFGPRLMPLLRAALAGRVADCANEVLAAAASDCGYSDNNYSAFKELPPAKVTCAMAAAAAEVAAETEATAAGWEESAHALLCDTGRLRSLVARHLAAASNSPWAMAKGAGSDAGGDSGASREQAIGSAIAASGETEGYDCSSVCCDCGSCRTCRGAGFTKFERDGSFSAISATLCDVQQFAPASSCGASHNTSLSNNQHRAGRHSQQLRPLAEMDSADSAATPLGPFSDMLLHNPDCQLNSAPPPSPPRDFY